jgi:hypothetical protein
MAYKIRTFVCMYFCDTVLIGNSRNVRFKGKGH